MKVGIIAYDNCTASMLTGLMDILEVANIQEGKKKPLFEISILTKNGKPVNSFARYPIIPSSSTTLSRALDVIYVPGFLADPVETIENQKEVISWLKKQYAKGVTLTAACNGNLFLAEAGVLNGKNATTHWSLKDFFERRYPTVNLRAEKILVDEGDVISAAGVTACMNLALHLVARYGSVDLASYCSKIFLVDSGRKVQTPYLIFNAPKNHGDREIMKAQEWIEAHYQHEVTVESLLNELALSRRTLLRRFKHATGDSPLEYVQRVRIENAKRFLETTNKTFAEITGEVGYNDISSFQRLFKVYTKLTPREYRNKFTLILSN